MSTTPSPNAASDKRFALFNAIASCGALTLLTWILLLKGEENSSADLSFMPALNAALNSAAALLLCCGWWAIRRKRKELHRYLMVSAFFCSTLFLVSYLIYHYMVGDTPYPADADFRGLYFFILISHILLSVAIVPMLLSSFYFAYNKRFVPHKKVGKVLLPIWLYVSVTGVAIFLMLRAATGGG